MKMKRFIKLCFVFLLGVILIPMVHAAELPKTGVTYFMTYPNGEVEVTEDYNVAINPPEKLLYTKTTNANGVVPICDCMNQGTLRLVQHVPSGYTTNQREITIDLANVSGDVSFVDYRGGNPSTGRSILVILGIAAVVGATILVSKKSRKTLVIVPAIVLALVAYQVHAEGNCVNVNIKDGSGNPLQDVVVDIYGTPVVTAAPAIKLDANGGHFMNGKEFIYIPLPSAQCDVDELWDSMTEEEESYYLDNIEGAYRDGYYPEGLIYPNEPLRNGTVVPMDWSSDEGAKLFKIVGNGGTFNFHGEPLEELVLYDSVYPYDYIEEFSNGENYYVGYDNNASCSNYTSGGSHTGIPAKVRRENEFVEVIYLCWNAKPDGIYVNNILFRGNAENCFNETDHYYENDSLSLKTKDNMDYYIAGFHMIDDNNVEFMYRKKMPLNQTQNREFTENIDGMTGATPTGEKITSLEIIQNGHVVVSLTGNDLVENDGYIYQVGNTSKKAVLANFLGNNINACYGPIEEQ